MLCKYDVPIVLLASHKNEHPIVLLESHKNAIKFMVSIILPMLLIAQEHKLLMIPYIDIHMHTRLLQVTHP